MLELEEARARIFAALPAPNAEAVPLSEALGRICAQQVLCPTALPAFDNSAMDGYAVRAVDLAGASAAAPARLRLAGRVAAGEVFDGQMSPGECIRLFTGSPLPRGADAVVMQEDTRLEPEQPGQVLVLEGVRPGENVRSRGEDVKPAAPVAEAGERLIPGRIMLLAASGVSQIVVGRRPKVALLATGSELIEPGQPLAPGKIYESNRLGLAGLVARAGGLPELFPIVLDEPNATRQSLQSAFERCDVVITAGGVSVGEMDFVKQAFEELGGELRFWKVAIKPGRPFVFGRWGKKLLFGLPGNPVSAFVTFLLLARPALLRFQGAADTALPSCPGILGEPLANPGDRTHFVRVRIDAEGKVFSAGAQASHVLSSLAAAKGLLRLPPQTTLRAGQIVSVQRVDCE